MRDTPPPSYYEPPEPDEEPPEDPRGGHGCGHCGRPIYDDQDECWQCQERLDEARHEARGMMEDFYGDSLGLK